MIKFVSKLPPADREHYNRYDENLAEELTRNRGKWAVIRTANSRSSVAAQQSLLNHDRMPNLPASLYEAVTRDTGNGWTLYIRRKP